VYNGAHEQSAFWKDELTKYNLNRKLNQPSKAIRFKVQLQLFLHLILFIFKRFFAAAVILIRFLSRLAFSLQQKHHPHPQQKPPGNCWTIRTYSRPVVRQFHLQFVLKAQIFAQSSGRCNSFCVRYSFQLLFRSSER